MSDIYRLKLHPCPLIALMCWCPDNSLLLTSTMLQFKKRKPHYLFTLRIRIYPALYLALHLTEMFTGRFHNITVRYCNKALTDLLVELVLVLAQALYQLTPPRIVLQQQLYLIAGMHAIKLLCSSWRLQVSAIVCEKYCFRCFVVRIVFYLERSFNMFFFFFCKNRYY